MASARLSKKNSRLSSFTFYNHDDTDRCWCRCSLGAKNRNLKLNRVVPRSAARHPATNPRAAPAAAGRGSGRSSYSTSNPILDLPLVVVVEAALRVDMRRPPPATADRPSPASRRRPFAHLASISLGEGVARPAKP